jgi:streptogramin lyase
MGLQRYHRGRQLEVQTVLAVAFLWLPQAAAGSEIQGRVVDINGRPVQQAQVLLDPPEPAVGASIITVFSDASGVFRFPGDHEIAAPDNSPLSVRALGFRPVDRIENKEGNSLKVTFVLTAEQNQAAVAPASAWLERIEDPRVKSGFVMDCVDCHQVPAPEVRDYAAAIADLGADDPALARAHSWNAIVKYMNYLSAWEFSRGSRAAGEKLDTDAVYSVNNGEQVAALLSEVFDDRLDSISGYDWGAPIIANANTVIREYEIPRPNAVREALLLGDPQTLWVADVSTNRMFGVDVRTGAQVISEVPADVPMGPHSLHRGADGSLWVTPLFNGIIGQLDVDAGTWQTWRLETDDGKVPGIHDLSFGYRHELVTDDDGNVWFSDIGNTAVGYFDPQSGKTEIWPAPPSPGRPGFAALYGFIVTRDGGEAWYSQLANGTFGGFDIAEKSYIGPFQLEDPNAGPRRITIDDEDVMYIALYGSGQLMAFDTKTREFVGIYDLPDTGSAPYSATWDPVREVVWVVTSNGDVIYRFDPRDRSFGVLPMPRQQAFMRMLDVDPDTGVLVTSYANIVENVHGPRMALIIDPGDGAYPKKFSPEAP